MNDKDLHNFDFVLMETKFSGFATVAANAEKILSIDPAACVLNCRRAMEFAIKWMYAFDGDLDMPADDSLNTLMGTSQFRQIVDRDMRKRMEFIRKMGNAAAHEEKAVSYEEAVVCLENLHIFLDFVDYCYGDVYEGTPFFAPDDAELKEKTSEPVDTNRQMLETLLRENASLREELAMKRAEQQLHYRAIPLKEADINTRRIYLEALIKEEGWEFGKNLSYGVVLPGFADGEAIDYLLQKDDGTALAVVELKYTLRDLSRGRTVANMYAERLEKLQGYRPVVFMTNGFDFVLNDYVYPERAVAGIYHPDEMQNLLERNSFVKQIAIKDIPTYGIQRPYQLEAVQAILESFHHKQRKVLISMAAGSGKTRVVMATVKSLMDAGRVGRVLYLTDKDTLITQTGRLLQSMGQGIHIVSDAPDSSERISNVAGTKQILVSTYSRISEKIQQHTQATSRDTKDKTDLQYGIGCFDLIICDEVHQMVYRQYMDVVEFFDGLQIGLTAIPAEDIDTDTYEQYDLEPGSPTYSYTESRAMEEGYLVPYQKMEVPDYGKKLWETDYIRKMLNQVMNHGIRLKGGSKLGKTIIFAINAEHCEKISEVFRQYYPQYPGYCEVIEGEEKSIRKRLDNFSDSKKLPQIAVTSGLLETGADIPQLLNLVFFKKVFGNSRFRQMLGRGNRLCPGLLDGMDKQNFAVFDYAGNFEWFAKHKDTDKNFGLPLNGEIWLTVLELLYRLQGTDAEESQHRREQLIRKAVELVDNLDRGHFGVRQHMQEVTYFSDGDNYKVLTEDDLQLGRKEVAPLLTNNRMVLKEKATKNEWHVDKIRELQMLRKELREL